MVGATPLVVVANGPVRQVEGHDGIAIRPNMANITYVLLGASFSGGPCSGVKKGRNFALGDPASSGILAGKNESVHSGSHFADTPPFVCILSQDAENSQAVCRNQCGFVHISYGTWGHRRTAGYRREKANWQPSHVLISSIIRHVWLNLFPRILTLFTMQTVETRRDYCLSVIHFPDQRGSLSLLT